MLGERVDRLERLVTARAFPVREQLLVVERRPFGDESERAPWQLAGDQLTLEIDRSGVARIARVEVWARVHALVPVHPDCDSVEEADPRHSPTLRTGVKARARGHAARASAAVLAARAAARAYGRRGPGRARAAASAARRCGSALRSSGQRARALSGRARSRLRARRG